MTASRTISKTLWDVVVIGTGFGGSLAALRLAKAGLKVLLLERGRWVDRDDSAADPYAILVDRKYRSATPYEVDQGKGPVTIYPDEAVGGLSVYYGAASFRLREWDFSMRSRFYDGRDISNLRVEWPIQYGDLAPFYSEAERLLGVAGVTGADPTEPPHVNKYPQSPIPYSEPARRIAEAAIALGLHPFQIPLAINFNGRNGQSRCVQDTLCDLFPCKIGAKNDLAVSVLPRAMSHGAIVRPLTVAKELIIKGRSIIGIRCMDTRTGQETSVLCGLCVMSAGAIGSVKLLLASGLGDHRPNGRWIGRNLMRHCNGISAGLFPFETNPEHKFHKQVGITDFYQGRPELREPCGPWGMLQGLQVPPPVFIQSNAPFPLGLIGARTTPFHIYLLCIAGDLPDPNNRIELDTSKRDVYGIPIAKIFHRYHRHDLDARRALYREAARILRKAGALIQLRKNIETFSHAVGSVRFGSDPETAALDPWCNFFGIRNLFVVDGSFMPTSGCVNPSLTIAANGLRVGKFISENWHACVR